MNLEDRADIASSAINHVYQLSLISVFIMFP
mgnify:FL=1